MSTLSLLSVEFRYFCVAFVVFLVYNYILCGKAPVNDLTTAVGWIGMKPSTTKAHLLRAAIESLGINKI